MRILAFICLSIINLNAFSNFDVGRSVKYSERTLGSDIEYSISEKIIERDEEFGSHLRSFNDQSDYLSAQWVYDDKALQELSNIEYLINFCESHHLGTYEVIELNWKPHVTCKLHNARTLTGHLIGNINYDNSNSAVWVGHGPYNGIFKVVDYGQHIVYNLKSFY